MHTSGLLALFLSSALSSTPKADAPTAPRAAATEIDLEVVEHGGGKASSFGFVVPIEGSIEAWINRGEDPRHCKVHVNAAHKGLLRVELDCSGSGDRALQVKAIRTLSPGKRTRIAEVTRPDGAKSQVFATLQ
jgi:hypothetical protein